MAASACYFAYAYSDVTVFSVTILQSQHRGSPLEIFRESPSRYLGIRVPKKSLTESSARDSLNLLPKARAAHCSLVACCSSGQRAFCFVKPRSLAERRAITSDVRGAY